MTWRGLKEGGMDFEFIELLGDCFFSIALCN